MPPFPYHKVVTDDDLSEFNKSDLNSSNFSERKLVFGLENLSNQVLNIDYAILLAKLGVKLTISKAIKFYQSRFLLSWVEMCSKARANAATNGDTASVKLIKLLVNSVYGKFLEQRRGKSEFKIVNNINTQMNIFRNPLLKSFCAISPHIMIVEMKSPKVNINRPLAVGCSILDNAKCIMNSFYYGTVEARFGIGNCPVNYIDTDSLILQLPGKTRDEAIGRIVDKLDTSNYPVNHKFYSNTICPEMSKNNSHFFILSFRSYLCLDIFADTGTT